MTSIIAVQDAKTAGCVSYWTLGAAKIADLAAAWQSAGLDADDLPNAPSPDRCLAHAIKELTETRRLARPLPGGEGWALVDERVTAGTELEYAEVLRAKVGDQGLEIKPTDHPLAAPLEAAYRNEEGTYDPGMLSEWMTRMARRRKAVGLRDTGGVYFLPQPEAELWRKMARTLESCSSSKVYEIPAMRSEEAVKAILASVAREVEQAAADIASKIETYGARGLRNCEARCVEVQAIVSSYEAILGESLADLKAKLETLQGEVVAAALRAEEEAEKGGAK